MARVVVVGGGFGGLASAVRLAKLGHDVTLLERSETLGGALAPVTADGFTWDAGATSTLLLYFEHRYGAERLAKAWRDHGFSLGLDYAYKYLGVLGPTNFFSFTLGW